ncbi:MAG: restriction endonuclease subunit S [Chloroflexota bacterium]|nr:MAG: restriction endonuclease subunit S [Chloroflexota bacterium]
MNASATVELGEIIVSQSGSVDPSRYADEVFDLYSIPAFDSRQPEVVLGREIGSAKQVVQPGDVLLSKIVPHIRRSWVVGENRGRRIIASGEWIVFRGKRIHPEYLRHVLVGNPFHTQFMSTVSGVGGSLLRARPAHVAKIKVPLPPLPEQRRIAEVLDHAEALRAKRRAALGQLDTLNQSVFLEMFGDPATNPKGWPRKTIGEIASKFSDGPFGSNLKSSHYTETGVRVVRLQNIGVGEFVEDNKAYISEQRFAALNKHECRPGDVLVGTLGDPNLRACILPEWLPVALNKADCVQLRPDKRIANAPYICALLNQPATESMAQELIVGQTRLRISMGRLRGLAVPVPPLNLQHDFARRVSAVEKLKAAHRASLAEFDALFSALQHRAFRGEL